MTKEMLGVYRPSEHIDNPTNLDEAAVDPRTIDEDFEALVRPGDAQTQVNPHTSKKHHIDYAESYMRHKLFEAATLGKTPDGMRCFGEALHVLEDYFAHSNFVELSLIKQGHAVLPWTTPNGEYRHALPVVTGLFSSLDVIASVVEPWARYCSPRRTRRINGNPVTAREPTKPCCWSCPSWKIGAGTTH